MVRLLMRTKYLRNLAKRVHLNFKCLACSENFALEAALLGKHILRMVRRARELEYKKRVLS